MDGLIVLVAQRPDAAVGRPAYDELAGAERSLLNQEACNISDALLALRFDHRAPRGDPGIGDESHDVGQRRQVGQ